MPPPKQPLSIRTPDLTKAEGAAIRALSRGEATPGQQKTALACVVKKLSRAYDLHFIPGSPDETTFLAGRGYVGQLITKIVNQGEQEDAT